jgi:hypothetical protein
MREFVREQSDTFRGTGLELVLTEEDVVARGKCLRSQNACVLRRRGVGMQPYCREIRAHAPFHDGTERRRQRIARTWG